MAGFGRPSARSHFALNDHWGDPRRDVLGRSLARAKQAPHGRIIPPARRLGSKSGVAAECRQINYATPHGRDSAIISRGVKMISPPQPSHSVTGSHGLLLAWRGGIVVRFRQVHVGETFDDTRPLSGAPSGTGTRTSTPVPVTNHLQRLKGPLVKSNRRVPEGHRHNRDFERSLQLIPLPTRSRAASRTGAVG
jgi:hypothetical protein